MATKTSSGSKTIAKPAVAKPTATSKSVVASAKTTAAPKKAASKKPAKVKGVGRPKGSKNQYGIGLSSAIREIISKKGRFMHQRELVQALLTKVGKKVSDPTKFGMKTSVLLFAQKNNEKLAQYSISGSTREKYYGMPDWLDKNDKPKPTRKPVIAE